MIALSHRFDAVTDVRALARRLADRASWPDGLAWERLEVPRVLPWRRDALAVQFRVPGRNGDPYLFWGELDGDAASESSGPAAFRLEDLGLTVHVAPHDARLKSLPRLLERSTASDLVHAATGAAAPRDLRIRTVAYRLERRCVLRYEPAATPLGALYVKVVRARKLAALVAAHRAVERVAAGSLLLHVPELAHVEPRLGAAVFREAPGRTLHALGDGPGAAPAARRAGAALRVLHAGDADGLPCHDSQDELPRLERWADVLIRVRPELEIAYGSALARLRAAAGDLVRGGQDTCLIHADFYDKQVLATDDDVVLIDMDGAGRGDPARDVGNFLAHVRLRALQHGHDPAAAAAVQDAFLAGYGGVVPPSARVEWWRAAACLRLAALYSLRPRWRTLAPNLLEEVHACLDAVTSVR